MQCTAKVRAILSAAQSLAHESVGYPNHNHSNSNSNSNSERHTNKNRSHLSRAVVPLDVFSVVLNDTHGIAPRVFQDLNVDVPTLRDAVDNQIPRSLTERTSHPDRGLNHILSDAYQRQQKCRDTTRIHVYHLLLALVHDPSVQTTIESVNPKVTASQIKEAINGSWQDVGTLPTHGTTASFPILNKFAENWTHRARAGEFDPVIGRDEEIERAIQILSRRTKNNPVLVGDAGVGKTAIVEGITRRIASGHVPTSLQGNLFSLDVAHLLSGTKYRGEFESRVQGMLHDIQQTQEPVILFIDELHTIVGTGAVRDNPTDLASLLKPMLARGELRCIGATTLDEYRQYIEKDTALERRFQPVYVDEPSPNATMAMIQGIRRSYELHHSVLIQQDTITHAVQLTDRYVSDRKLPDKAIDALDEACAAVALRVNTTRTTDNRVNQWNDHVQILYTRLRTAEENGEYARALDLRYGAIPEALAQCNCRPQTTSRPETYVTPDDVAAVVAQWTGIPVERLHESDTQHLLDLPARLQTRIRGQSQAIQAVSDAIIRSKTGMSDATRPIGVFLFLGPTGVGKTELAKAICAEVFQQSETQMVRLDMSEYMESHSVSRLLGAPPGYVRSDEGGQLTEPVRRRPYNVVLLDEIEKAHTLVLNTLLQVFEDGRLTDAQGRHVNFRNTVIIMTSNLGSTLLTSSTLLNDESFDDKDKNNDRDIIPADIQRQVLEHVREFFLPELFNRIDQTVLFHPLRRCDLEGILDAQTHKLQENLQKRDGKTNIHVSLSPEVRRFTLKTVYDPSMGARPLIRWVEQNIASALSTRLLRGDIPPQSHVIIEMESSKEEELLFTIHDESHTGKCDARPWLTPSSW